MFFEFGFLVKFLEDIGEIDILLIGDLGSRGIRGGCIVFNGVDIVSIE